MLYSSTRGEADIVSSSHAIAKGLASDGGLFVPQKFKLVSLAEIAEMNDLSYSELAAKILGLFLTDFSKEELNLCTSSAYDKGNFDENVVNLSEVEKKTDVFELWHGPTSAFKDMALQLLPYLMVKSVQKTGETNKLVILVATSGDTGKAALDGFADVKGIEIIVFYPEEGVSDIQKQQMITQAGNNVHVLAVKGNFDDAQTGVKKIFSSKNFAKELKENGLAFSSANSINWGRLVPQIVYYFKAYSDAVAKGKIKLGEEINFSVPTGNFGDILAGYYAKKMGLPVNKFICASNTNKILADFLSTGIYDIGRDFYKTMSPSMDILVSSNLERLLYDETDCNSNLVAKWMESLKEEGKYDVGTKVLKKIQKTFFGTWVDEYETKETISSVFKNHGYILDPHTAVAWSACEKYRVLSSDNRYSIVLSTASPYKFNDAVLSALDKNYVSKEVKPFDALRKLAGLNKDNPIPKNMLKLENAEIIHKKTINKEEMAEEIKAILNI